MTVPNQDGRTGPYNGNGSTTVFAYDFLILDESHIVVTLTSSAGVETTQTITTHYTVSGVGNSSGGNVTMLTAPASGETLTLTRDVPKTQLTDYQNRGSFQPNTVETALDKVTQITQDIDEVLARTPKFPVSSTETDVEFPATLTADAVIKVNTAGDGFENGPTTTQISNAETNATNAAASATLAQDWASKTDGIVASTDYSSKAWAIGGTGVDGAASGGAAKNWATKTDGTVDDTEYAAKAWAIGGTGVTDTASAGAAKEWATAAEDDLVDGSEYSAKHYSAKASAQATAAQASATAAAAAAASNLVSKVSEKATDYTIVADTDDGTFFIADSSGGNVDFDLPSIATAVEGERYVFFRSSASNSVTLTRNGSDTINGVAGTYTMNAVASDCILVVADDASPDNWVVVPWAQVSADGTTITKTGSTISIADNGVTPEKAQGEINAQTGTTYTLVLTDDLKTVTMTNASANTLTIPANSSVAFPTGARLDVWMLGAGTTTITGDTGVTVNGVSAGSGAIEAQYNAVSLLKTATDTWVVAGAIGTVA